MHAVGYDKIIIQYFIKLMIQKQCNKLKYIGIKHLKMIQTSNQNHIRNWFTLTCCNVPDIPIVFYIFFANACMHYECIFSALHFSLFISNDGRVCKKYIMASSSLKKGQQVKYNVFYWQRRKTKKRWINNWPSWVEFSQGHAHMQCICRRRAWIL